VPEEENPFAPKPRTSKRKLSKPEVLVFAVAAGVSLLIVLQRNGSIFSLCSSMGMESVYLQFEQVVLGEPPVSTPRGVERLMHRLKPAAPVAIND
jgi:hypothetical protein